MAKRRAWRAGAAPALLLGALAVGCGGGDESGTGNAASGGARPGAGDRAGAANAAPVIESVDIEPEDLLPGHVIRAVVQASDADGDRVQLRYAWQRNGSVLGESGSEISPRDLVKGDEISLVVVASDGREESAPVERSARIANRPPTLFGVALELPDSAAPGRALVASPRSDDPDGDELSYQYEWRVNGEPLDAEGPELSTDGLKRGDRVEVVAVASDGEDESAPQTSRPVTIGNSPPRVTSDVAWTTVAGVMQYTVEAQDPDGDRSLRYRLLKAPENMQIDPIRGEVRWKPTAQQKGKHAVEIEVDDLRGGRTIQRFEMAVNVEEQPAAPETAAARRPAEAPDADTDDSGEAGEAQASRSRADADEASSEEPGEDAESAPPAARDPGADDEPAEE